MIFTADDAKASLGVTVTMMFDITNIGTQGYPGTGKTSILDLAMGKEPAPQRNSTGWWLMSFGVSVLISRVWLYEGAVGTNCRSSVLLLGLSLLPSCKCFIRFEDFFKNDSFSATVSLQ